jgi:Serine hydrolase (FSH1)
VNPSTTNEFKCGADPDHQPEDPHFDAWTWGSENFEIDFTLQYKASIHHVLKVMRNEGPFIGIFGFRLGLAWLRL